MLNFLRNQCSHHSPVRLNSRFMHDYDQKNGGGGGEGGLDLIISEMNRPMIEEEGWGWGHGGSGGGLVSLDGDLQTKNYEL